MQVFLAGDGVACAGHGQRTRDGYYNVERPGHRDDPTSGSGCRLGTKGSVGNLSVTVHRWRCLFGAFSDRTIAAHLSPHSLNPLPKPGVVSL